MTQPATSATPEPGWRRAIRRGLYGLLAAVIVFAFGAGTVYFAWSQPLTAQNRQLTSDLDAARAELETLRPLVDQVASLEAQAALAEQQGLALLALVQVGDARVAMALGDTTKARLPLLLADGALSRLGTLVEETLKPEVETMRDRLALARGEFESDTFAAQRDLEVLANDLSQFVKRLR